MGTYGRPDNFADRLPCVHVGRHVVHLGQGYLYRYVGRPVAQASAAAVNQFYRAVAHTTTNNTNRNTNTTGD